MRIAFLGHKRIPSREGGVEVVVGELATRMAELGHDVTVYNRSSRRADGTGSGCSDDEYQDSIYNGVHIKYVPTVDIRGIAALTASFEAMKLAVEGHPDVIHVHAEGPCASIGIAKRAGIRTVATIHGLDWKRAKWGRLASSWIKHGERVAAKSADEIIVLSEEIRRYFEKTYNRKTHYIENGVDLAPVVPPNIIFEKYNLIKNSYILYLGRIVPEKGLHYLIDAFIGLDTGCKLIIAGGPSDSKGYYESVKRKSEKDSRIQFIGHVDGNELAELYSNALFFVLPSDLEGMPMSLLEAMSYGQCCLTSDIPECADVIAGCGLTFARSDVKDLRRRLGILLHNGDFRLDCGLRARQRVLASYNWDSVVARTLEVYRGESA